MRYRVLLLQVAAILTSGSTASVHGPPAGENLSHTGVIEGRLVLPRQPARRRAERYAGGAMQSPRTIQPVPAVVFLRGRVGEPHGPAQVRLAQRDTAFTPAVVVVSVGSTVEFPNEDPFFHNVFSYSSPQRFDLGRYPGGESKAVRFDEPGIVRVYCEVHETMRSAVIVTENPYHVIIDGDGVFTMRGVPEGRWQLEVWHPDLRGSVVEVTVEAGHTTPVTISLS